MVQIFLKLYPCYRAEFKPGFGRNNPVGGEWSIPVLDLLFFPTEKQRVICKKATKTKRFNDIYLTLSNKQFFKKNHRESMILKNQCACPKNEMEMRVVVEE